jgi:enoyl-CoA hydratase
MGDVVTWRTAAPGVVQVTMASPPANALSVPVLDGLHAAIDSAEAAGNVKVMVVSSALDGFFAAGADIKHLAKIDAASFTAYGSQMRAVNDRLAAAPWISIAAVDGLALGGGLELAMACTMRVAGAGSRYGLPEVKLGLIPGAGGTQRLPRLVGRGRAIDIMLTARQVPAAEALSIGLVDRLSEGAAVGPALALAHELTGASLPAQRAVVRAVDAAFDLSIEAGFGYEMDQEQKMFEQGEAAEGITVAQVALQAVAGPSRTAFIHVAYARPIPVGTKTRFEGRIVHGGRSFAVVQVTAVNESGKPCAFATVTTSDQGARR